ncbi:MAG: IPTL-CTERM sorting domain-containing protein [Candidatus Dadabacteria bacterium]|nr:IPTL-CTERM sorting domain-containing protein [Candidatus Dadabacteria bacterium]
MYVLPAGIPTLGQWGLISLGLILLIIGAFYLRRRKARA